MARTLSEDSVQVLRMQMEINGFVEHLVSFVYHSLDIRVPPDVTYIPFAFPDNIKNAVLEIIQTTDSVSMENWCQNVIAICLAVPGPTYPELTRIIHQRLTECALPVTMEFPSTYIRLFLITCKLAVKFYQAMRIQCVRATVESLKAILREQRINITDFRMIDRHAITVIDASRSRRR